MENKTGTNITVKSENEKKPYETISPAYQQSYKEMRKASKELEKSVRDFMEFHSLEDSYLKERIMKDTRLFVTSDFSHVSAESLKKYPELNEDNFITEMDRATKVFNTMSAYLDDCSPMKDDDCKSKSFQLMNIDDSHAFVTECIATADSCLDFLNSDIDFLKTDPDPLREMLGTHTLYVHSTERVADRVSEIKKYFESIKNRPEGETINDDSFPINDVSDYLDELSSLYALSFVLVMTDTAQYPRKNENVDLSDLIEQMKPVYSTARFPKEVRNTLRAAYTSVYCDALDEMGEILDNDDNFTGYHIAHTVSGDTNFVVGINGFDHDEDCMVIDEKGPFSTEKDAEAYEQDYLKTHHMDDNSTLVSEVPAQEWFSVVRNSDDKAINVYDDRLSALADIYDRAHPTSFEKYVESHQNDDKTKEELHD